MARRSLEAKFLEANPRVASHRRMEELYRETFDGDPSGILGPRDRLLADRAPAVLARLQLESAIDPADGYCPDAMQAAAAAAFDWTPPGGDFVCPLDGLDAPALRRVAARMLNDREAVRDQVVQVIEALSGVRMAADQRDALDFLARTVALEGALPSALRRSSNCSMDAWARAEHLVNEPE